MKNYGYLGGYYPPQPTASTDNTLLDLHNSSQDIQPHSFIVKYQHRVRHGHLAQQLRREQTQRCFCVERMLEFRSERHTEYVY